VFGRGRVALSVVLNCFMNTLFRNPVCFGLYKIQHASKYKKKKKKKTETIYCHLIGEWTV